jgi:hypothetical protein
MWYDGKGMPPSSSVQESSIHCAALLQSREPMFVNLALQFFAER